MYWLEGVHIFLCERPLVARGSFRMSICKGRGGSDGKRNNGRKYGKDYSKGQKIALKNGTEERFKSMGKHCDGLLYCSGNGCGSHWVPEKASVIRQSKKLHTYFFLALHPYPRIFCVDGSRAVLTVMPDSACRLR
jgi:hypothetical protein